MEFTEKTRAFIDSWKNDGTKLSGNKTPEIKEILAEIHQKTQNLPHEYSISQRLWCIKHNRSPTCPHCRKDTKLNDRLPVREQYCSFKCGALSKETKEKRTKTSIDRYGVSDPAQTHAARIKRSDGVRDSWNRRNRHYSFSSTPDELGCSEWIYQNHIVNNMSCPEIADTLGVSIKTVHKHIDRSKIRRKRRNNPKSCSKEEQQIEEFLKKSGIIHIKNYRPSSADRREVDFYLPEHNFCIEYDGIYWHSYGGGIPPKSQINKHQNKKIMCMEIGIGLIQVWDCEWSDPIKRKIVESTIQYKARIGINTIRASKCDKVVLSPREALQFFDENHIQGRCPHSNGVYLGLIHQNTLVAAMSFGTPRFNKKHCWELIRFCVLRGNAVHGGAGRLFKWFLKDYTTKGQSIISYCNLRYGTGKLYEALGFQKIGITDPSYFYYNTNTKQWISRYKAQKHKLPLLLGEGYSSKKGEIHNMLSNGYHICYDSGNLVYSYIS